MQVRKKYEEEILKAVQVLHEDQLAKVVSLIEKLQLEENTKQEDYRKAIEELHGKYRDVLSSVDEFMARKEEEKKVDR